MSDKDKLIALLSKFGVGYEVEGNTVICMEGSERVEGYSWLYTTFTFDSKGEFVSMGAWE